MTNLFLQYSDFDSRIKLLKEKNPKVFLFIGTTSNYQKFVNDYEIYRF